MKASPICCIERVVRDQEGTFTVTFYDPWKPGNWLGVYRPNGTLKLTIWRPARHVPSLSPSFLESMASR